MFRLKDPAPRKNRWGQAIDWFLTFFGMNVFLNSFLLGRVFDAPMWLRYVCLGTCFVAALFLHVIGLRARSEGPPRFEMAEGSNTNADRAAVRFHAIDRS